MSITLCSRDMFPLELLKIWLLAEIILRNVLGPGSSALNAQFVLKQCFSWFCISRQSASHCRPVDPITPLVAFGVSLLQCRRIIIIAHVLFFRFVSHQM